MTFPYDRSEQYISRGFPRERTHEEVVNIGLEVEKSIGEGSKVQNMVGVVGTSVFAIVPKFDIILGTTIDYMHCVLSGIGKMMLGMFINSTNKEEPWYIGQSSNIRNMNIRLQAMETPSFFHRKLDDISDYGTWKAFQVRVFLLFCCFTAFNDILPDLYLQHFLLLSEALHLMLRESIRSCDIDLAEALIGKFCLSFEELYGMRHCTSNLHSLLHLPGKVRLLGPLWAHSCFFYEDLNGDLRGLFHGTRHIAKQMVHAVSVHYTLPKQMVNFDILQRGSEASILFSKMMGQQNRENRRRIQDGIYAIGAIQPCIVDEWVRRALAFSGVDCLDCSKFFRMKLRGHQIHSSEYRASKVHNNRTIQFMNPSDGYGEVRYFLCCSQAASTAYFAVVKKFTIVRPSDLKVDEYFGRNLHEELITQIEITDDYILIPVSKITNVCVRIVLDGLIFVSVPPNSIERN